jgi:hypothetical protein
MAAGGLLVAGLCWVELNAVHAQPQAGAPPAESRATLVLTNGKIITVDERFAIAQAVAIRGDRIVAVGTNQQIDRLVESGTRRIDLRGRAVIPGLIDNHMHLLRYGTTWRYEVRWDGVGLRTTALGMLRARTQAVEAGEWIYSLGGWTLEQFADNPEPFTREELDQIAPNHPVFLQASYFEAFLNSRALQLFGIDGSSDAVGVERDATGRPTGRLNEAGFRALVGRLPVASEEEVEASSLGMIGELNRAGLTTVGSSGCEAGLLRRYRQWADTDRLNIRVFCITQADGGGRIDQVLPQIARMKFFQGDTYIDHHAYGEHVLGALSDPMFEHRGETRADDLAEWRRVATEIAKAGLPLHVHANFRDTIDTFLDQFEEVNREYPIGNLRWVLAHLNQPTPSQLARMKELGLYAAVHPWAVINGGINIRRFGDAAYDMAPLAAIQQSGITWGLGSDGSRANQVLPFHTLSWAVTGEMVGGRSVLRQPIGREDALIAHTRKNAYLVFQEDNLGSIQAGKLADLVVLDRDYLTVPADQIKDLRSVMTIVGGRIVYDLQP